MRWNCEQTTTSRGLKMKLHNLKLLRAPNPEKQSCHPGPSPCHQLNILVPPLTRQSCERAAILVLFRKLNAQRSGRVSIHIVLQLRSETCTRFFSVRMIANRTSDYSLLPLCQTWSKLQVSCNEEAAERPQCCCCFRIPPTHRDAEGPCVALQCLPTKHATEFR